MNYIDISILTIAITVIASGYYVNFKRKLGSVEKEKESTDNTLLIFRLAVPIALVASIFVYFMRWGEYAVTPLIYVGLALAIFGIWMRWYAIKSLGAAFQVRVTIVKGQQLNKSGLYKTIRHPSYTGLLIYYLGLGLMMHNYISLAILIIGPAYAVFARIKSEEKFLTEHFGEAYSTYQKESKRLIPYFY